MRIVQILRELNISLTSLNQEMKFLRLPEFQLNDKVSDADYSFIKEYFLSEEMKELEILIQRVNDQRMLLKKIFLLQINFIHYGKKAIIRLFIMPQILYWNKNQ